VPDSVELYNIAQDPSEKNNVAAQNPGKVAELQKRANELAKVQAQPLLLQLEFQGFRKRLSMPPALPGEEFQMETSNSNGRPADRDRVTRPPSIRSCVDGGFALRFAPSMF